MKNKKFSLDHVAINRIVESTLKNLFFPESLKTKEQYLNFIIQIATSAAHKYTIEKKYPRDKTAAFISAVSMAMRPYATKMVDEAFEGAKEEKEAHDKYAEKFNNSHAISAHRFLNEVEDTAQDPSMVKAMLHISRLFIISDLVDTDLRTISEVLAKNHCRLNSKTKSFSTRLQQKLKELKFMLQDFTKQLTGAENSEQIDNIDDCDFIDALTMLALDRTAGDDESRDKVIRAVTRLKSKAGFIGKYINI